MLHVHGPPCLFLTHTTHREHHETLVVSHRPLVCSFILLFSFLFFFPLSLCHSHRNNKAPCVAQCSHTQLARKSQPYSRHQPTFTFIFLSFPFCISLNPFYSFPFQTQTKTKQSQSPRQNRAALNRQSIHLTTPQTQCSSPGPFHLLLLVFIDTSVSSLAPRLSPLPPSHHQPSPFVPAISFTPMETSMTPYHSTIEE